MNRHFWIFTCLLGLLAAGCQTSEDGTQDYTKYRLPILNGVRVTGNDYLSTVGLSNELNEGENAVYCTGTLIAPQYVLTAAHCVADCDDGSESIQDMVSRLVIIIGQSGVTFRDSYKVDALYSHPDFTCKTNYMMNDIAIIRLDAPVTTANVVPTPPLPPSLALTPNDVDLDKIQATVVGFGRTDPKLEYTNGSKYRFDAPIHALCSLNGQKSQLCGATYTKFDGFFYFQVTENSPGTCNGDSGGPTFINRNGTQFVAGVTSFGYDDCQYASSMTNVSDYYDFIKQHVPDIISETAEDCYNGVDDNSDGRTDCDDPYCSSGTACIPEDCSNQKDDNGNGLTDCDDPQCSALDTCKKEICGNDIDDDDNGLTDCSDPQCADFNACKKEICGNDIDDDDNGLTDCDDPACMNEDSCKKTPEDNCDEDSCAPTPPQEICDNDIDDDSNGKTDCDDKACKSAPACAQSNPTKDPETPEPSHKSSSGSCSQNPSAPSIPTFFLLLLLSSLFLRKGRKTISDPL